MRNLFTWAAARLVAAFALALPLAAMAVTTAGYEQFGDTAGVMLWRGGLSTNDFHTSTVIDVASDGTPGAEYAMTWANNNAQSSKRFCRTESSGGYSAPGLVLVYDEAGYRASVDSSFTPLSFGGLWVKALQADNTPYTITGASDSKERDTEFGNSTYVGTTLFKFEKSFTIDRKGAFKFLGTANIDVAEDAVFSINASYPSQSISVPSGSTFKPTGKGSISIGNTGIGLSVAGALDLSASTSTRPIIVGNVTLNAGATLVFPSGTTIDGEAPFTVCSGTLTASDNVYVKIGDGEAVLMSLTVSGGAITATESVATELTFTEDFPNVVPFGCVYTFIGGDTTDALVTLSAVTVNGTLKTSKYIKITDIATSVGSALEVLDGVTTVGGSADCKIKGSITIDAGATLKNIKTDSLNYNSPSLTVDVYGTLDMGTTRWSVREGVTFKVHPGAAVTGAGDSLASLDFLSANGIDVYGGAGANSVTIEGPVRVRGNESRFWVDENMTLVLAGGIKDGSDHHGGFKQVGPGTLEIHANSVGLSGNASIMTQGKLRLVDTTLAFPVELQGSSSYLEVVATGAETNVPVKVTSIANNNVTFSGAGKVSGSITKTSAPGGNLATALQSSAWTGTFVADWAGAHGTQFDANAYGNANSVVEVTKLVGGYVSGSNANVTVVPTIKVSGFMKLENGYSGKVTTLTKLTGGGVFTNETYSVDVTTLDNFTGMLVPLIDSQYVGMRIGTINLSSAPVAGDKIVNLGDGANIGQIANTKVSVNGVVDESFTGKLEVKSDGIYVKANVTITITPVTGATATVTVNGEPREIEDGHITVTVGDMVVVTYTGDEDHKITGSPVEFEASTTTTSVDTSSVTSEEYKAQVMSGTAAGKYTSVTEALSVVYMTYANPAGVVVKVLDPDYEDGGSYNELYIWDESTRTYTFRTFVARVGMKNYDSLAEAMSEVTAGGTVVCLVDAITLDDVLVITNEVTLGCVASGTTITGADLNKFIRLDEGAALKLVSTISVNCQIRFNDVGATVTVPEEDYTEPSMRPITGYSYASTSNGDGTKTYSLVKTLYLYAAGVNVTLAYSPSGETMGAIAVVNEGDVINFTATPAEGYENPVVTANNVTLTPEAGVYSVTIGDTNMTIQATATEMPKVAEIAGGGQYASLSAAFANAQDGNTIKVLADNTLTGETSVTNNNLTLDLNGFTVTGAAGDNPMFNLGAVSFTIKDTSAGGAGKVVSPDSKVILSGGPCTFTLESGTLESGDVTVYIWGDGEANERVVNINGGKLICNKDGTVNAYAVMNINGTVNMTSGEVESKCSGFDARNITVSGGSLMIDSGASRNVFYGSWQDSIVTVTGGTFNRDINEYCASGYAAYEYSTGIWTVSEVYVEGQDICLDGTNVTINASQAAWLKKCGDKTTVSNALENLAFEQFSDAYLLNLNILDGDYRDYEKGDFIVTDFHFETENETEYVVVGVSLERHGALLGGINGTLKLMGTSLLGEAFVEKAVSDFTFINSDTTTLRYVKDGTTLFFKPVIE